VEEILESQDLKNVGLKVTLPRMKILEILEQKRKEHLSAEDIYRILMGGNNEIGLATIYRVLTQFESAGLVTRHHFEGGQAVFELDCGTHHDHIVCVDCGRVEEFMDEVIEERQKRITDEMGFELRDHSMILYGVCKDRDACLQRRSK